METDDAGYSKRYRTSVTIEVNYHNKKTKEKKIK